MQDKTIIKEKTAELIGMTAGFCDTYLDEEYKELCEKLIRKMSRKRQVPFLSGQMKNWAAGVVYAIGSINFLFDKSFEPYVSVTGICDYFGTKKSTTSQKSKDIQTLFKLSYFDDDFSTSHMQEKNPFKNLVMVNGLIIPKEALPPELQEILRLSEEKE